MIPFPRLVFAVLLVIFSAFVTASAQTWSVQPAPTTASLRGISVISARIAWASGTGGTCLRTTDGGKSWISVVVPGAGDLDFRGISAHSDSSVWLLSSGQGDKSRIYRTSDGGISWKLVFTNPDAKGFFDGIAFWDDAHGVVFGDPVDGRFVVLTTSDAGATWKRERGPVALPDEGAFAASNTSLVLAGSQGIWFASGGIGAARIFHSTDRGRTWTAATTPLRNDAAGAGIFSLAILPDGSLVAVGGDYAKPRDSTRNIAMLSGADAGWHTPATGPRGYRSGVAWLSQSKLLLTVGPSGSELSRDHGETWQPLDNDALNAISVGSGDACWAVGPKGRISRFNAEEK